jgi:aspartate/methionine/tyrosine aminotransferase
MIAAMLAILDPGDEVIVFEPFYENYGPDAILTGATPRYVTLHEPDWSIDPDELRAAVTAHARDRRQLAAQPDRQGLRPREELELIAELCREHDLVAFTDEIYEHIVYGASTSRSRRCPAWRSGRSRSTRCRRRTPSPGWRSAGSSRRRSSRRGSARRTTS